MQILFALAALASGQTMAGDHIDTGHDMIPDFAHHYMVETASSGYWDSPATWKEGKVPMECCGVRINPGHTVTVRTPAIANVIGVAGKLRIGSAKLFETKVGTLLVYDTGTLELLSGCRLIFRDLPLIDGSEEQFSNGLICLGTIIANAPRISTWVYSKTDLVPGQTAFAIDRPLYVSGSKMAFADARTPWVFENYSWLDDGLEVEERDARFVAGSVKVSLTRPLSFHHKASTPIAVLQSPIIVRSENPNGVRGHVMFTGTAKVRLNGVTFEDLGRTTATMLDPVHNHIGRYSLHFHQLHDPLGSYVRNCVVKNALRWGAVLHGIHNIDFSGNTIYNVDGAGISIEAGSEIHNTFDRNYVLYVKGHPLAPTMQRGEEASQRIGSGFWINMLALGEPMAGNMFRGNVVANCKGPAYNFFAPDGQDKSARAATNLYTSRPVAEFSGNTAISTATGLETWRLRPEPLGPIVNFKALNVQRGVAVPFATTGLILDGCLFTGTRSYPKNDKDNLPDRRFSSQGMFIDGGYLDRLEASNVVINGFDYGIYQSVRHSALGWKLKNVDIYDAHTGILDWNMVLQEDNRFFGHRPLIMDNVRWTGVLNPLYMTVGHHWGEYMPLSPTWEILSLNHNGSGSNYKFYFPEQAPLALMHPEVNTGRGSYYYGTALPNSISWDWYRLAVGMDPAPTGDVSLARSLGITNGMIATLYNPNAAKPSPKVMVLSRTDLGGYVSLAVLGDRTQAAKLVVQYDGQTSTPAIPADSRPMVSWLALQQYVQPGKSVVAWLEDANGKEINGSRTTYKF